MAGAYFKGGKIVGGGGEGDTDTFLTQTFDNVTLADFTQTGLILEAASPISGTTSAKLIHQTGVNQSFQQIKSVSEKFRGASVTISITAKSGASLGNVTILFRDETNNINIQSAQQVSATTAVQLFQFGVKIPSNCQSFSYTITALPEAGSPATYIDDVSIRNYWIGSAIQGQSEYTFQVPSSSDWLSYTPTVLDLGTGSFTSITGVYRRVGSNVEVGIYALKDASAGTSTGTSVTFTGPFVADNNKLANTSTNTMSVGTATFNPTTAFEAEAAVIWSSSDKFIVADAGINQGLRGDDFPAGARITMKFSYPVLGWVDYETKTITVNDIVPSKAMSGNATIDTPIITLQSSAVDTAATIGVATYTGTLTSTSGSGIYTYNSITGIYTVIAAADFDLSISAYNLNATSIEVGININGSSRGASASPPVTGSPTSVSTQRRLAVGDTFFFFNGGLGSSQLHRIAVSASAVTTESKTWTTAQAVVTTNTDTMLRLEGVLGYGSTNTSVIRFTSIVETFGSDVTYAASATLGDSFTVNKSGVYHISGFASTAVNGDDWNVVITKNSSNLVSFPTVGILSYGRNRKSAASGNNTTTGAAWSGYLSAGTIIRLQTDTQPLNLSGLHGFTIAKEARLDIIDSVSDQKIIIPTSEVRFEGSSARGSSANTIVKFDSMTQLRGDAFTIVNTVTDGTYVQMNKDGRLSANAGLLLSTAGSYVLITKNQQILTSFPLASEIMASDTSANTTNYGAGVSSTFDVKVGDIIRIYAHSTPVANVINVAMFSFQEQGVAVSVTNSLPQYSDADSSVRVDTSNGYGSSATRIRRFSSTRDNFGKDITYVDSSTNGGTFTINSAGTYSISYSDVFNSGNWFGISKNAPNPAANISGLTGSNRLAVGCTSAADFAQTVSWQGYLAAGDIIRAHTDSTPTGTANTQAQFTITKIGKPNVTGVDVTSFIDVPRTIVTEWVTFTPTGTWTTGTWTGFKRRVGDTLQVRAKFLVATAPTGNFNITLPDGLVIDATKINSTGQSLMNLGSVTIRDISAAVEYYGRAHWDSTTEIRAYYFQTSGSLQTRGVVAPTTPVTFAVNDTIDVDFQVPIVGWDAESDTLVTEPETFNTDTARLQYASSTAYTLSTLTNAPVGTFITFTYGASSNGRVQTTTAPTQTTANMNSNGIQLNTRVFTAASAAGTPSVWAIQIGKGLKGISLYLYKGTGRDIAGSTDLALLGTATQYGIYIKEYNELTGVLVIDTGISPTTTITAWRFIYTDTSEITSGYLVINASKNPALTGVFKPKPVIARAIQTSGQSFVNNTITTVTWDSVETYDTHDALNPATGVFTCPTGEAGYYDVKSFIATANVAWTANVHQVDMYIYKNGSPFSRVVQFPWASLTNQIYILVSDTVYLDEGNTVDIRLAIARGTNTTLYTGTPMNFVAITKR